MRLGGISAPSAVPTELLITSSTDESLLGR